MYYALVHFLENYPKAIDVFREKYDARFDIAGPHITLVFPVDFSISEKCLFDHVENVLNNKQAFDFSMSGIEVSWDNFVFLLVSKGNENFTKLHDDLYSSVLKPYFRTDIGYTPHVTLGKLTNTSYSNLKEAEDLNINFSSKINKLTLIKRSSDMEHALWSKEFMLE